MREPNQEELRMSATLERGQGGARFNLFTGTHAIRHAGIDTWWERVLAIVTLALVLIGLTNLILRNF
jgi:hypothetical protein